MYFVNWQRDILIEERNGLKVVVKRNKRTKSFHEYILLCTYAFMSILLGHPSGPPSAGSLVSNEGQKMRSRLAEVGIPTPRFISMTRNELVEEYVRGGDLYRALASCSDAILAREAGRLTALAHSANLVFTDNKAQNFLVDGISLVRTDLAFLQTSRSTFARSMDVGSFLASVIDLKNYREIEEEFHRGYKSHLGDNLPYLSLVIRNILALGFSADGRVTLHNMILDSSDLIG